MRRDTLGPFREAGVRHKKYARLSLARTRVISRKMPWMLHREPPGGCLAFPKGDPETGSLIDMSIVIFAAATLCRCLCWAQLPEGEKQC